ncbi:MAG: flavodoxin [Oscillospiraceae bacterium]|jgi:flavodoxin|nr:flavodoxin [Oscillospiraceae bacterium]
MKKCLIIYDSYHHGNTKKIASAMAEACQADLCTADEAGSRDPSGYDIIGLGSGIAAGRYYGKLRNAAEKMDLRGKQVFVFSTSGTGKKGYNIRFMEQLKRAGANVVGDFACCGFNTFGPFRLVGGISKGHPDKADLEAAGNFAREMTK